MSWTVQSPSAAAWGAEIGPCTLLDTNDLPILDMSGEPITVMGCGDSADWTVQPPSASAWAIQNA